MMSIVPWRRNSAGTAIDGTQPGSPGSPQVTWAEAVLRVAALGWPETIRLCVIMLIAAIAWAGCHTLASWWGTLL